MKPGLGAFLLVGCLISARVGAQQSEPDLSAATSSTNGTPLSFEPILSYDLNAEPADSTQDKVVLKRGLKLTGPLVSMFKGRGVLGAPARLLQMINPFSKAAPAAIERRVEPVEARAWTTIVGWSPGRSAFPDDEHHEPQLRLFSVSTASGR